MYEAHFQLKQRPFSSVPQVSHYFPASAIEQARLAIINSVDRQAGPTMVIGPVGTGKTMLQRALAEHYREQFRVLTLPSGRLATRKILLQALLYELDLEYRDMDEGELRLALIDHVTSEVFCPNGVLLLVDEADSLPMMLLEELRILTNLVRNSRGCVLTIMFGTNRLEERFAHPRLESFNQRIAGRYYLESYSSEETRNYIENRLSASGRTAGDIFPDNAIDTIHELAAGVPRLINQLCQHALVLATAGGVRQIDELGVREAWSDLQQLPAPEISPPDDAQLEEVGIIEFGVLSDDADSDEANADGEDAPHEEAVASENQAAEKMAAEEESTGEEKELLVAPITYEQEESDEEADEEFAVSATGDRLILKNKPEIELVFHGPHDPFDEQFEQEEVVVHSRPGAAASLSRRSDRTVSSTESEQIAQRLPIKPDRSVTLEEDVSDRRTIQLDAYRRTNSPAVVEEEETLPAAAEADEHSPAATLEFDNLEDEQSQFPVETVTTEPQVESSYVQDVDYVLPDSLDEAILQAVRETQREASSHLGKIETRVAETHRIDATPSEQSDDSSKEQQQPVEPVETRPKTFGRLFSQMLKK